MEQKYHMVARAEHRKAKVEMYSTLINCKERDEEFDDDFDPLPFLGLQKFLVC